MKRKKSANPKSAPRKMSTKNLCVSLVAIAAFHVDDEDARKKIYEAVRRLEAMEAAAMKAAILSPSECKLEG